MECTVAVEQSRQIEKLGRLETDAQHDLVLHIRHCLSCKETLSTHEYLLVIQTVLFDQD